MGTATLHFSCEPATEVQSAAEVRFVQAPQFLVAFVQRQPVLDAPDDDGVAAVFRPQLRHPRQAQETLGFEQGATQAEGQHDGMIAAGQALSAEDVVDHGGVQLRGAHDIGALHPVAFGKQLVQVVARLAVERFVLVEVFLGRGRCRQAFQQIFGELFGGHDVLLVK